MPVRTFIESDIPQVVELYREYLGFHSGQNSVDLQTAFKELYFSSPWVDPDNPSLVYENESGHLLGFLGFLTRRVIFRGEALRVRVGGNFVVHPAARSGIATPRILQAMFEGTQDMLFSDSANDLSRKVLERVGFQIIHPLSIHWSRPLQPAAYVVHALSRGLPPRAGAAIRFLGKPAAKLVDRAAARWKPIPAGKPGIHVEALGSETLLQCICQANQGQELQQVYDTYSLDWLLRFLERSNRRGRLRKIAFREEGRVIGWCLYYVKPAAVGEVVQLGFAAGSAADTIVALLNDARTQGLIALHGVADYQRLPEFSEAGCLFTCRGGWALAYSKRSDLIDSLQLGKSTLSRLDGEWCLQP